jgi:hypothetical protein
MCFIAALFTVGFSDDGIAGGELAVCGRAASLIISVPLFDLEGLNKDARVGVPGCDGIEENSFSIIVMPVVAMFRYRNRSDFDEISERILER